VVRFAGDAVGNPQGMIGLALALVIVGIVLLFFLPWVGIPVGVVGVILLILFLVGFGRRAASTREL
jgi:Flp pilus assembly protein TadB